MNLEKFRNLTTFSIALVLYASISSFANSNADDKTVEKAREAVENASPDDWYTLAVNAEKCFKKNVNMQEAAKWLDRSIEIAETPYNMELKGDYYAMNRLPEKALDYYLKAMNLAKSDKGNADVAELQKKISKIVNIGG